MKLGSLKRMFAVALGISIFTGCGIVRRLMDPRRRHKRAAFVRILAAYPIGLHIFLSPPSIGRSARATRLGPARRVMLGL
jgi:hypothetical protein